ncbi:MAG: right-handed parallel beta-helix repeat-containing protein [Planctomycetales bacterium]
MSPQGRDQWTGRPVGPNQAATDGPFASVARARDAVRQLRKTSSQKEFLIQVQGGVYRLSETLVFGLEDSAPTGGRIVYSSAPGEKVVFSSGVPIKGWRKLQEFPAELPEVARGNVWVADLPAECQQCFSLFDGEERLERARGPGFSPPAVVQKGGSPANRISFPTGALRQRSDLAGAELRVIPTADYEMSLLPLATVDEAAGVATTIVPASRPMGAVKFYPICAWAENVLAVLDEPGEWVFNPKERRINYWPKEKEPGDEIVVPRLHELLRVEGKIDYDGPQDTPVMGLTFRGVTSNMWNVSPGMGRPAGGCSITGRMFDRPSGVVRFRGAEDCALEGCRITAASGTGVRLDLHCRKNRIVDNEISHVGQVGVLLAGYGPGTKDVNRNNEVCNNWIHHTGEIYWASPGLMVWQSGENKICRNLIHNTPYSGVTVSGRQAWVRENVTSDGARTVRWAEVGDPKDSIEWEPRERFLHGRKNLVEGNDIHHVMEVMGDGDGIYISGTGGGNLIRGNHIHDCTSDHLGDGIRCDDFQQGVTIEKNVIHNIRCVGQGICSKGQNHILNNIIADLKPSGLPIRPERIKRGYIGLVVNPVTGSKIQRNIVANSGGNFPLYVQHRLYGQGGEPRLRDCDADFNLYFCDNEPQLVPKHLATERALGVEKHSVDADPLFVDRAKGDLRLKPESPAWKLGFEAIDMTQIGLLPGHPYFGKLE